MSMDAASWTAVRAFTNPLPCSKGWASGLIALARRISFVRLGFRSGLASSIRATVPVTNGVAMLAPLKVM